MKSANTLATAFFLTGAAFSLHAVPRADEPPSLPSELQGIVVSDTNRFTCGSGTVACLSPDKSRLLVPYLASTNGFGECHDLTAVADVPLNCPAKARSFVVCQAGENFRGKAVKSVVSYSSFVWKGWMRIFLDVNFDTFGYRDWDPETQTVVGEGLFSCRTGASAAEPLTPAALSRYLKGLGLVGFDPCKERGDRCIWQNKPQVHGGAFYGFVTSSCSQPVLFRCADGETFEFVGAIPTIAAYECQLAILDGRFYAVMRGASGDNFWTSEDGGKTWQASGRLPDGLQRPQLLVWRRQVLIGYSAPDEKPCAVRNGRNNLHLLWGRGRDLSAYRELLHAVDPIGIVYPDLVDVEGDLHLLWSNSARFPKCVKWGAVQGKDQVLYAPLKLSVGK